MSGNVAEWCEDAYIDSYNPIVWDLNPIYRDDENDKKSDQRRIMERYCFLY